MAELHGGDSLCLVKSSECADQYPVVLVQPSMEHGLLRGLVQIPLLFTVAAAIDQGAVLGVDLPMTLFAEDS